MKVTLYRIYLDSTKLGKGPRPRAMKKLLISCLTNVMKNVVFSYVDENDGKAYELTLIPIRD